MKIGLQRKLDRVVGPLICGLFDLFSIRRKEDATWTKPKNILVILLTEMGSLVLARPMFAHIRKKYPDASTHVLLFDQNREVLELLDVVPWDNILTVSNRSLMQFLKESIQTFIKCRQIGIDTVIDCELFSRVSGIYSFLSGAKIRAGFHPHTQEGLYRGNFINRPVLYNPYIHVSHQFITLVESIESGFFPTVKRRIPRDALEIPHIKFSREEIDHSLIRFKTDFPRITGKGLVLVYPGGGLLPIRAWPPEYFFRLVDSLVENGYTVGIVGTEKEKDPASAILSHCKKDNCIDLTGYTESIRELLRIFHFASLLISNDGGPGHFAALTPMPVIILYGPETPDLYGSLSPNAVHFYIHLSCSPCLTAYNHRNSPCDGNNLCLKNISPEEVLSKAYEILEGKESTIFSHAISGF